MNRTTTIFLADDDEDDRMMFGEALREVAIQANLHTANDGEKLLSLLSQKALVPNVIFLDLNMPNKNGKECLKEIRSKAQYDAVPVVIYSTSSNKADLTETYQLGANLYLEKPSSYSALVHALADILTLDWKDHQPKTPHNEFRYVATSTRS